MSSLPRDVTLADGRTVHLRAVLASDEEEILQAFARLGPEARYLRFLVAVNTFDVARLRAVLASFPQKGGAIAATVPAADGIDIVGAASFLLATEDAKECEFSISIPSEWSGAGLGQVLMEALVEAARARGLVRMLGYVLAVNQPMLGLAAVVGFTSAVDPDDSSMRIVTLPL